MWVREGGRSQGRGNREKELAERAGACTVLLPMPPQAPLLSRPRTISSEVEGWAPWIPPWLWGEQVCYCWA